MNLARYWRIATSDLPILFKVEIKRRFPSLFDRLPLKASAAWLNPTDNCNMRCIMCNQWRETKTNELTLAEWKDTITQLRDAGITKIGFNGGEPLLRKDFVEMVQHVTGLGMGAALITSGFLLDQARLDSLIKAGLKHITLSLDGVGPEYEKIRGREWARVANAAALIAEAYKAGKVDANIGFVIMKQTLEHLDKLRDFAKGLGLPLALSLVDNTPFFFKLAQNKAGAEDTNWIDGKLEDARLRHIQKTLVDMKSEDHGSVVNSYSSIDFIRQYFSDPLQSDTPCTVSQLRVMINSHGEVFGGCWSMGSWGCLRQQSLREILDSPKFKRAHKAMFYKKCPGCSCGFSTNLQYSLPIQTENRLYNISPSRREKIHA